jgi:hypothetical protein
VLQIESACARGVDIGKHGDDAMERRSQEIWCGRSEEIGELGVVGGHGVPP